MGLGVALGSGEGDGLGEGLGDGVALGFGLGVGFGSGTGSRFINNVANQALIGYAYNPGYASNSHDVHKPLFQGADTSVIGEYRSVNNVSEKVEEFDGNEAIAVDIGFSPYLLGTHCCEQHPHAQESVIKDFRAWNFSTTGVFNYMSAFVTFINPYLNGNMRNRLNGDHNTAGAGITSSDYPHFNWTVRGGQIIGCITGFVRTAIGDITFVNTKFDNYRGFDIMKPWGASHAYSIPASTVTLESVRFVPDEMPTIYLGPQYDIGMFGGVLTIASNQVAPDRVFVYNHNGVQGNNYQLFFPEQNPSAILPRTVWEDQGGGQLRQIINGANGDNHTNQQVFERGEIPHSGMMTPPNAGQLPGGTRLIGSAAPIN